MTGGTSFICNTCGAAATVVKDTRPSKFGKHCVIRRRRLCTQCGVRTTTIEIDALVLDMLAGGSPTDPVVALREIEQILQRYRAKFMRLPTNGRTGSLPAAAADRE